MLDQDLSVQFSPEEPELLDGKAQDPSYKGFLDQAIPGGSPLAYFQRDVDGGTRFPEGESESRRYRVFADAVTFQLQVGVFIPETRTVCYFSEIVRN